MEHEASIRPGPRDLLLRALAVAFAVAATSFLIVREQRRAQPAPGPGPAVSGEPQAPSDGAPPPAAALLGPAAEPTDGAAAFLMGTKSAVLAPHGADATYLPTSKSLPPMALVSPAGEAAGETRYLFSSKSAAVDLRLADPPQADEPAPSDGPDAAHAPRSRP
jgi:hypothetical protein